jgi:hypothetical protein
LGHKVFKVSPVQQALKVVRDLRVSPDLQVLREHKDLLELLVQQVPKDKLVHVVIREQQVLRVQRGFKVSKVRLVSRDQLDRRVKRVK